MSNGGDFPIGSGPGASGSPGGGGGGTAVNPFKEPDCNHKGYFNPIQQTVIDLGDKLLVVSGANCKQCGKVITDLTTVPLGSSPLAKPQGGIIKP